MTNGIFQPGLRQVVTELGRGGDQLLSHLKVDLHIHGFLKIVESVPACFKKFIVIINDQKVSREDYADIAINGDDEVVLLPPIKGG